MASVKLAATDVAPIVTGDSTTAASTSSHESTSGRPDFTTATPDDFTAGSSDFFATESPPFTTGSANFVTISPVSTTVAPDFISTDLTEKSIVASADEILLNSEFSDATTVYSTDVTDASDGFTNEKQDSEAVMTIATTESTPVYSAAEIDNNREVDFISDEDVTTVTPGTESPLVSTVVSETATDIPQVALTGDSEADVTSSSIETKSSMEGKLSIREENQLPEAMATSDRTLVYEEGVEEHENLILDLADATTVHPLGEAEVSEMDNEISSEQSAKTSTMQAGDVIVMSVNDSGETRSQTSSSASKINNAETSGVRLPKIRNVTFLTRRGRQRNAATARRRQQSRFSPSTSDVTKLASDVTEKSANRVVDTEDAEEVEAIRAAAVDLKKLGVVSQADQTLIVFF